MHLCVSIGTLCRSWDYCRCRSWRHRRLRFVKPILFLLLHFNIFSLFIIFTQWFNVIAYLCQQLLARKKKCSCIFIQVSILNKMSGNKMAAAEIFSHNWLLFGLKMKKGYKKSFSGITTSIFCIKEYSSHFFGFLILIRAL